MNEEKLIKLLVMLYKGLSRLGPGNSQSTLKALSLCKHLPDVPDILDIGCGTGAQTLTLASATSGRIIAVDLIPEFLEQLNARITGLGLQQRLAVCEGDMNRLPFPDHCFDLVWSEGAAYIMGFDNALREWKRLIKPGGHLVVSEVSWFKPDPPAKLKAFWDENYPAIRSVQDNLVAARTAGWETIANFHLPSEAWSEDYYGPLKIRLQEFRKANAHDKDALQIADMTDNEIRLFENYSDYYGYEFYILRGRAIR
ncbi:class I SAM-dependent methyltransferase [Kaarinaea lacus]